MLSSQRYPHHSTEVPTTTAQRYPPPQHRGFLTTIQCPLVCFLPCTNAQRRISQKHIYAFSTDETSSMKTTIFGKLSPAKSHHMREFSTCTAICLQQLVMMSQPMPFPTFSCVHICSCLSYCCAPERIIS